MSNPAGEQVGHCCEDREELPKKHRVGMPLEMLAAWVIVLATRKPDRLSGKRIVGLPIVKVSLETPAHTDPVVGCHRHITLIEESMQIRAEQEAIVYSMLPVSRYRADVRCLEHRQCLLACNRTPPLINVSDEHSERTLSQSLTDRAYPPVEGNLGSRRLRNLARAYAVQALEHHLPELVSYRFVEVVGLALNGLRAEVRGRWKPICFGEEVWFLENDAPDRVLGPRIGGYASIALDAPPHLIIGGRAVLFPERFPGHAYREH